MSDQDPLRIQPLSPQDYRRTPWKNGGGVSVDIAAEWREGDAGGWSGMVWRFGRTAITAPGPFSDLSGFDRVQIIVAGRGLSLRTPDGAIDLRAPFSSARFAGETPIVSQLDDGPVEVVNLIGARASVAIGMLALNQGESSAVAADICLLYAPAGAAALRFEGRDIALAANHAARIDQARGALACAGGPVIVASVNRRR